MNDSHPLPALEAVVPHRRPMLLLDRLVEIDSMHAVCEVDVHQAAAFAEADGIASWVGIEYMAQTVAAVGGWRALRRNDPVQVGLLLGTRRYVPARHYFEHGTTLRITAREEWTDDTGMAKFACGIGVAGAADALLSASLSVYQPGAAVGAHSGA